MQRLCHRCLPGFWGGWLMLTTGLTDPAAAQVFTLDTNQSSITISGRFAGYTVAEQTPGSLTTKYAGTIQTALTGDTIQFTGQSLIEALDSGNWQPKADGSTGSAPANYGALANAGFATANAALRTIQLDVISPRTTINSGQFDSRSLTFFFPSNAPSTAAYNVTGFISKSGSIALSGHATNDLTALSTLATVGTQQILTIPVNAILQFSLLASNDTSITLQGQLVAVRDLSGSIVIGSPVVRNHVVTLQWQAPANQSFKVLSTTNFVTWVTNAVNVTSSTTAYTWSGPTTATAGFLRVAQ